ncbi:MAG: uncharacterized protein A8A55_2937 [Amphiamblys sp. WSBS2006]|nr:MAG: uncharacterized protein A8A55_2937 [Amphiamblys sp. WSBS2006]
MLSSTSRSRRSSLRCWLSSGGLSAGGISFSASISPVALLLEILFYAGLESLRSLTKKADGALSSPRNRQNILAALKKRAILTMFAKTQTLSSLLGCDTTPQTKDHLQNRRMFARIHTAKTTDIVTRTETQRWKGTRRNTVQLSRHN